MKTKSLESKKDHFNRISMRRIWSVPLNVRLVMQNRKSWDNGLTSRQLLSKVKINLRDNKLNKKSNKIKLGSVYNAVSKINLYHEPPFYICNECRMIPNGKMEHRYYIPSNDVDIEKERGKQIRMGTLKFTKERNVREFGEELEKEQQQKQLQEIKLQNEKTN